MKLPVVCRYIGGLVLIFLFSPVSVWARESPTLSIDHKVYEVAGRLNSRGLLNSLFIGTKPQSRYALTRPLVDLLSEVNSGEHSPAVLGDGVQDDLLFLLDEFREEVEILEGGKPGPPLSIRFADPLSFELAYTSFSKDDLRLRENHFGDVYRDGFNHQLKLRTSGTIGKHLSWALTPKVLVHEDGAEGQIEEAVLKGSVGNVELAVGRESLWWGPGIHGALLLSNNAPPLNLVRIGSREAFRLPFFLKPLGLWQVTAFYSRLESARDVPRANLTGLRIGYKPVSFLEFGASRVTMWGGEGRPGLSVLEFFEMYFTNPNQGGNFEVNDLASVDMRVRLPSLPGILGGDVYAEVGGEDEGGMLPTKRGFLTGLYLTGLFGQPALDFRAEYAGNHVPGYPNVWYRHFIYTSGYTHKGVVLGHHMGTDAESVFLQLSKAFGDDFFIRLSFDQERHFLSSPVQERKREYVAEFRARVGFLKPWWTIRYEYEGIRNHNAIDGEKAENHYVTSRLEYTF